MARVGRSANADRTAARSRKTGGAGSPPQTFRITVDYSKSVAEMIAAVRFDNDVEMRRPVAGRGFPRFAEMFPVAGSGTQDADVFLVDLGSTNRHAGRMLEDLGLAPARFEHLLAFAVRYPEMHRKYRVIAIGSTWTDAHGRVSRPGTQFVPFLCYYLTKPGGERTMNLSTWDDSWRNEFPNSRFLAVRQSPPAETVDQEHGPGSAGHGSQPRRGPQPPASARSTNEEILGILDRCCDAFTFPALDNGYVYLAATRLTLYRSPKDWALVIEVFGFSPREGRPSTSIYTFASRLHARDRRGRYRSAAAYRRYLRENPHNESRFIYPVADGDWQDPDDSEYVATDATHVKVRRRVLPLPPRRGYAQHGIRLESRTRIQVFELCRYLAAVARDDVLATPKERRISVPPDLKQVLQLEEWHHPDVVGPARPSGSATFQQLARILESGNPSLYEPSAAPNTHWSNWPDGGSL